MSARNVDEESRLTDIEAADRDANSATCECCHERPGTAWCDRQWLCDNCQQLYGTLLDSELAPARKSRSRDDIRRKGFGGSDAGVLAGVDPYRDLFSLVMEKRGELEPMPATERQVMGKFVEQGIIRGYEWKTGRSATYCDVPQLHPTIPHMVATPDAICLPPERRGVDAKVSAPDQWAAWAAGPPAHYVLQCQWYMAFYAFPLWDIARWNGSDLTVYTVEADQSVQEGLLRIGAAVWRRFVAGNQIPVIGISEASGRYLAQHYPRNTSQIRPATVEEEELLDDYADIRRTHEEICDERAAIENRLKLLTGDAEGILSDRAKFTWKRSKDSVEIDWEQVAGRLLDSVPQHDREILLAEFTRIRPGTRRIHFTQKGVKNAER